MVYISTTVIYVALQYKKFDVQIHCKDNNPMGNAAAWDEMVIQVDGTSKPFKFLTPNGSQTFITGQKIGYHVGSGQ